MRVNIWNVLDKYTVFVVSWIKVDHCAFGRHECAVYCDHPEDTAHSKGRLILCFSRSLWLTLFVPFFPYVFISYALIFSCTRASKVFIFSLFWPNSSISYASYVLFIQNALVQTIPQLCSYKFTIAFLFSRIASWGLRFSQKPGYDVNAAYWRQGSDSRR